MYYHSLRLSISCLSFFLLLFSFASATDIEKGNGQIGGRVTTNDGSPAASVTLLLKGTHKSALTEDDGTFSIRHIKPGTYELSVSFVGYQHVTQTVVVEEDKTTVVNIQLTLSSAQLQDVRVTGARNKLVVAKSDYAAKVPLKNLENAQVYSTVTKELQQQQVVVSLDDALKNVTGVAKKFEATGVANGGGAYYTLRGFTVQAGFRNGMVGRFGSSGTDNANIENVEVLKGPSATLFGSVLTSYGGLINRVTKKPYNHVGGEVAYTAGSHSFNRVSVDYNTPLDSAHTALFRINGAWQDENSFKDNGFRKSIFIAPSFSLQVNDRLSLTFDGEFSRVQIGGGMYGNVSFINSSILRSLFGVSANSGIDLSIPKIYGLNNMNQLKLNYNLSYTSNDLSMTTQTANLFAQANYKLSSQWTSQTNVATSSSRSNGYQTYMYILPNAVVDRSLSVTGYDYALRLVNKPDVKQNGNQLQQNFIGDFRLGGMRNRFVGGLEFYHNDYRQDPNSYYGKVLGITYESLFDLVPVSGKVANYNHFNRTKVDSLQLTSVKVATVYTSNNNVYSAYASDVLNVTDQLLVSVGLRVDRFQNRGVYDPVQDTTTGKYGQTSLSPKFGLVYAVIKDKVSLFGNYQNGFTNQTGTDYNNKGFKPEQANQWEGGVKASLLNSRLTGSVSYYNIQVKDIVRSDNSHYGFSIQDGTQLSKGFEAEVLAVPVAGLNVLAGYAYNNSKYTKADSTVQGLRPVEAGPEKTINFWVNYRFTRMVLKGFGVGFGGNYAGESYAVNTKSDGQVILPAYTVLNAAISYEQPKFRVTLKMNNLGNKHYWIGWNGITAQMPRQFLGSIAYKF